MDVQTFYAPNMKAAVAQVKKSLGKDAVILSTHESIDNGSPSIMIKATSHESSENVSRNIENQAKHIQAPSLDPIIKSIRHTSEHQNSYLRQMMGTMTDIKALIFETLRNNQETSISNIPEHLLDLYQQLLRKDFNITLLSQLMDHLSVVCNDNSPTESILHEAVRWMSSRIQISAPLEAMRGRHDVHLFIGPPGSGKSSIIAKLAHKLKNDHNLEVAVLSYEPIKLAPSGSLQILSRILGFQFSTARDLKDLKHQIKTSRHAICLIDTSGFLPSDETELSELMEISQIPQGVETHLVLSLLAKSDVLNDMVLKFSPVGISSLMFSSLDACISHSDLFNLPVRWSIPLSYSSNGHQLPEGIERMTREKVIELTFGI